MNATDLVQDLCRLQARSKPAFSGWPSSGEKSRSDQWDEAINASAKATSASGTPGYVVTFGTGSIPKESIHTAGQYHYVLIIAGNVTATQSSFTPRDDDEGDWDEFTRDKIGR